MKGQFEKVEDPVLIAIWADAWIGWVIKFVGAWLENYKHHTDNIEQELGLPYDDTGNYAGVWVTNRELIHDCMGTKYHIQGFALTRNYHVIAVTHIDDIDEGEITNYFDLGLLPEGPSLMQKHLEYSMSEPLKKDPKSWVEDFPHENGLYQLICICCQATFYGHKRRVSCKECDGGKCGAGQ